jgi:hypothetical protein
VFLSKPATTTPFHLGRSCKSGILGTGRFGTSVIGLLKLDSGKGIEVISPGS